MTNGQWKLGRIIWQCILHNDGTQSPKITWSSEESLVVRSSVWGDLLLRRLSLDPFPFVFSSTQVFQLICTFVPLLAVQIICPAVSPVCYANAWLPLCIMPPHPLVRHLHCHYLSPACISTPLVILHISTPPANFANWNTLVEIMSFIADIFLSDDDVSCWINVLICW